MPFWYGGSSLQISKPEGKSVRYNLLEGAGHQLTLEQVIVRNGEEETIFSSNSENPDIRAAVERARPDAAQYLRKIIQSKTQQYAGRDER